jgi:hypothetical protein
VTLRSLVEYAVANSIHAVSMATEARNAAKEALTTVKGVKK